MKILKLQPAIKDNLWGGTRLSKEFNIFTDKDIQAEAWTLSCHPDGENIIEGGDYEGMTLTQVLEENPSWKGTNADKFDFFPVLIKIIDANDNLSLQVHPDDEYARVNENQYGKTECWYILDAKEDAEIIYGLSKDMTKEELVKSIEDNSILENVNHIKVKPGELYYIPSGTIHAICSGILLAEVQQNSNVTYRIYDYNRLQNGKPRELHKEKAAEVVNLKAFTSDGKPQGETEKYDSYTKTLLVSCDLFKTWVLDVEEKAEVVSDSASFVSLLALEGNGVVEYGDSCVTLYKGESVFIPAGMGKVEILGSVKVLETRV